MSTGTATATAAETVVEEIGEKLKNGQIVTGEAFRDAMKDNLPRFGKADFGAFRQAVRHYLRKYDAAELPQNEAVGIVMHKG